MKRVVIILVSASIVIFGLLAFCKRTEACSRISPIVISQTCKMAEYIVRATAVEYSQPPQNPDIRTTGVPDSKVTFKIEEMLKGDSLTGSIVLNGYLSDKDDFNDHIVPYIFVRRGGRAGSCFANTYKQGAQFLLFMKRSDQVFTVNIDALAPVNEQLHTPDDPWMYYIKGLVEGLKEQRKIEKTK